MPHVCAVRAREFAGAMARRGHRIVLLTQTLEPDGKPEPVESTLARLEAHDWMKPFRLACAPRGHGLLRAQRDGRLPPLFGKAVVGAYYFGTGSVFRDWGAGTDPYIPIIAERFSPQVVWATFGNTEALKIAQRLAAETNCGWVMDVKDYWSAFAGPALRAHLGKSFSNAVAMTALSAGHTADSRRLLPARLTENAVVVRSGIPAEILPSPGQIEDEVDRRRIIISGAIYDTKWLDAILEGAARAAETLGIAFSIEYAGGEGPLVAERAAPIRGLGTIVDHGYLPLGDLAALQRTALLNAFVRSGPGWFQHKISELIAAGRPILCVDGADRETQEFCADYGIPLHGGRDATAVAEAIRRILREATVRPRPERLAQLTWDNRVEALESILEKACQ